MLKIAPLLLVFLPLDLPSRVALLKDFERGPTAGVTASAVKSVALMSGSERVWNNECLTRAVALYLAQRSGRRCGTLLCDEADGALDADRKRMFMATKREVLKLGGYEREFFVSQTPELTAMADAVIDQDAMHANVPAQRPGVACFDTLTG